MQLRIILAFAATWLVWGSTYLAIAFAVRDIPPLMVAATLGWAFAGEAITGRLAMAMGLIVSAVAIISLRPYFRRQ